MLPPKLRLILSPQAQNDFADILQYTLETWGKAQALFYRSILGKALVTLQENPWIGHRRPDLVCGASNITGWAPSYRLLLFQYGYLCFPYPA